MEPEIERKGRIEYLEEGFMLLWDENELRIQVTDYHAKVLRLPWKDLLALARVASSGKATGENDQ
jgi:hypothetical protein